MNNILIVEDEHLIARLIEMTLTRAGYRCTLAEDGRTAADLIETTNFDMALLDIMLPGLDGYALLECLRPPGVPVIFITAKSAEKACCPNGDGFAPHRARRAGAVRLRRGAGHGQPHRPPER